MKMKEEMFKRTKLDFKMETEFLQDRRWGNFQEFVLILKLFSIYMLQKYFQLSWASNLSYTLLAIQ